MKLDMALKNSLLETQQLIPMNPGDNFLSINGHTVKTDIVYEISDLIRKDSLLIDRLHSKGLKYTLIRSLFRYTLEEESSSQILVNMRSSINKKAIKWYNNVEKDDQYKDLSKGLESLLYGMMNMGQLIPIRRNLYQLIIILEPTNLEMLDR
eukprot:UN22918